MPAALVLGAAGWVFVHWAVGVLAFVAAYAAACAWYPLASCWCCDGTGRHRSTGRKTFRRCSLCDGKGSGFRVGSRVLAHFSGREL